MNNECNTKNEDDKVEQYIKEMEERFPNESVEERPSVISLFFDQLNFKGLFRGIFKKTPIKVTDQFIDAILLFLFLLYIFYSLGVLTMWSSYTVLLMAIGLLAFLEFIGINTPWLKQFFAMDARTKIFLETVHSMTKREIEEEIRLLNFSSKCMNLYLQSIEKGNNKYPPYLINLVINTQNFRRENLDLLFSPNVLKYIRPEMIIKVLFKNRDFLTQENIQNIYNYYKHNDNIIKILIATQKDSYFLIKKALDNDNSGNIADSKFCEFYKTYQEEEKHLDWILKIIPSSKLRTIRNSLLFISFFGFLIIYASSVAYGKITLHNPEDFAGIFFAPFFLTAIVMGIFVDPIIRKIKDIYFNRYINNIVKI